MQGHISWSASLDSLSMGQPRGLASVDLQGKKFWSLRTSDPVMVSSVHTSTTCRVLYPLISSLNRLISLCIGQRGITLIVWSGGTVVVKGGAGRRSKVYCSPRSALSGSRGILCVKAQMQFRIFWGETKILVKWNLAISQSSDWLYSKSGTQRAKEKNALKHFFHLASGTRHSPCFSPAALSPVGSSLISPVPHHWHVLRSPSWKCFLYIATLYFIS